MNQPSENVQNFLKDLHKELIPALQKVKGCIFCMVVGLESEENSVDFGILSNTKDRETLLLLMTEALKKIGVHVTDATEHHLPPSDDIVH